MDADRLTSPMVRRVLSHFADPRPAWLWSGDGGELLWRNPAAREFAERQKRAGTEAVAEALPIKGQVARQIRLGVPGRNSPARMQFLVGSRPAALTCICTPLSTPEGQVALLIVGADPVNPSYHADLEAFDAFATSLLPHGAEFAVLDEDGQVVLASARAGSELVGAAFEQDWSASILADGGPWRVDIIEARSQGTRLAVFTPGPAEHAEGQSHPAPIISDENFEPHIVTPHAGAPAEDEPAETAAQENQPDIVPWAAQQADLAEPGESAPEKAEIEESETDDEALPRRSLTNLFDRLADDDALYTPLSSQDDAALAPAYALDEPSPDHTEADLAEPGTEEHPEVTEPETLPELVSTEDLAFEGNVDGAEDPADPDEQAAAETPEPPEMGKALYRVIGRGFTAAPSSDTSTADASSGEDDELALLLDEELEGENEEERRDSETVERNSRYNFDELARILTDRIGNADPARQHEAQPEPEAAHKPAGLVTLSGENFVLNRLSLGLAIFRDQQLLFVNRALVDLVGYESAEGLRQAGLAAIFPTSDDADQAVGPLHHLVRSDGSLVPVTARLQSISWQGRPALLLSANAKDDGAGSNFSHEAAVTDFARLLAETAEDGFIAADGRGVITSVSLRASTIIGRPEGELTGAALTTLIGRDDVAALRQFLDLPARFAETSRPAMRLALANRMGELVLFVRGQAGLVSGYFGFVRSLRGGAIGSADPDKVEPGLLSRISRGIRRPLNTVVGFADILTSREFDTLDAERRREYANDIHRAGQDIAAMVDELDDFARLKEGRYPANAVSHDLQSLLETAMARVRPLANERRVLLRSAISEALPRIQADLPSLTQGVLNLIASAIDHSPLGGQVVVSAHQDEIEGISIHVRDNAELTADLSDRFVVFRDGQGRDGKLLTPMRSSVGLPLTRALLAVNGANLRVEPSSGLGTIFTVLLPARIVTTPQSATEQG